MSCLQNPTLPRYRLPKSLWGAAHHSEIQTRWSHSASIRQPIESLAPTGLIEPIIGSDTGQIDSIHSHPHPGSCSRLPEYTADSSIPFNHANTGIVWNRFVETVWCITKDQDDYGMNLMKVIWTPRKSDELVEDDMSWHAGHIYSFYWFRGQDSFQNQQ